MNPDNFINISFEHEFLDIYVMRTSIRNAISSNLHVDLSPVYAPARTGDIKHSLASIEKASRLFGYQPSIEMKDGLDLTIEWEKKYLN